MRKLRQRGWVTCLQRPSWEVVEKGFELVSGAAEGVVPAGAQALRCRADRTYLRDLEFFRMETWLFSPMYLFFHHRSISHTLMIICTLTCDPALRFYPVAQINFVVPFAQWGLEVAPWSGSLETEKGGGWAVPQTACPSRGGGAYRRWGASHAPSLLPPWP